MYGLTHVNRYIAFVVALTTPGPGLVVALKCLFTCVRPFVVACCSTFVVALTTPGPGLVFLKGC